LIVASIANAGGWCHDVESLHSRTPDKQSPKAQLNRSRGKDKQVLQCHTGRCGLKASRMKPETPKRLPPKLPVLRQLYLMSGNQCAFPHCEARLVDSNGAFVAQLCHIEGIGKTSQRFNPAQTNEQRRAYANLLFLCYEHHVLTNDEAMYTVEKLREIKANHEKRFSGIPSQMLNSIVDPD
jgi:hypothetical protein